MVVIRGSLRAVLALLFALALFSPLATAAPGGGGASALAPRPLVKSRARARSRRPAFAQQLRRQLVRAGAEIVPRDKAFYHQIKSVEHRARWQQAHQQHGLAMLGKWLSAGGYPGLWTSEQSGGWYGDHGGRPVRIKLKPGALFVDLDVPAHKAVYEAWKKARQSQPAAGKDLFARLKDASGTELAKKVAGIRAPREGQFFEDLGIAGVVWHDTYGRRCPVVLNPSAVAEVQF